MGKNGFKFNASEYIRFIEENFKIVDKDKQEVPFILNKAQRHFVLNLTERNVILKARKMGFSSVLLAIACTKFIMGKNERCVSMSFDKSASAKQLERAKKFLQSWEQINGIKIPFKYNSKSEMSWVGKDPEGNTYTNTLSVGTAKSTGFGRGDDITFLHLTEVSLADHLDQLLAGVGEAVVNNAIISMETTANGYNEFKQFWDEAVVGARNYKALFYAPSWEYDAAFLAKKKAELGRLYMQEFPATPEEAFIASGSNFFEREAMQNYLTYVTENERKVGNSRHSEFRRYREFERGEFVVVFADTAAGGGDFCAAHFLSTKKLDVPLVYHKKTIATEMTPVLHDMLEKVSEQTGIEPVVAFERNNGGLFELERLNKLNRNQKYRIYRMKQAVGNRSGSSDSVKLGWDTNSATRPQMLTGLKEAIDGELIQLYDRPTVNEMFSFVEVRTTSGWKAQAERNSHDDLIMSLAGAWQLYQTERPIIRNNNRPRRKKQYDSVTGRVIS